MEGQGRVPVGVRDFPMRWTLSANSPVKTPLPPNPTPRPRPLPAEHRPELGALVPAVRLIVCGVQPGSRGPAEATWRWGPHLQLSNSPVPCGF